MPSPYLSPYIKNYWFLETGKEIFDEPQRIFPDGCMECIIHYGEPPIRKLDDCLQRQQTAFVFGQLKSYMELIPSSSMGIMGIRFFPHGLSAFTKTPLNELKQNEVSLVDMFGKSAQTIAEQIASCVNTEDRIAVMERFLMAQLRHGIPQFQMMSEVLKEIVKHSGDISINYLVKKYKLSEKHIERIFLQNVGIGPKLFSRILKFQNVFKLATESDSLTKLGLHAGYFDQSHFIREFRAFTGYSPREYFSKDVQFTQLFLDN